MKHLKQFENTAPLYPEMCYWKTRRKSPHFEACMDRIGISKERQIMFQNDRHNYEGKFMYFGYEGPEYDIFYFTNTDYYENDPRYKYMGFIEASPEEVEEWQMKKDIKKYNL